MALPTLTGVGRLTADPDLKFTQSGTAMCTVPLAFNSRRKNEQTGQWEDADVFYVRAVCWKQLAENAAETLAKGMEVMVSGELRTERWEKDGQKHEMTKLLVRSIAPNLAYATARVERSSGDSNARPATPPQQQATRGRQAPPEDPWATGGGSAGGWGGSSSDTEPPF